MNIEEFKQKLKEAKQSTKDSFYYTEDTKVKTNKMHTKMIITHIETCEKCKHKKINGLHIKFKKEQTLTIFQCGFLVGLYLHNIIVIDYHKYLDCQAAKVFIENIENIEVI